MRQLIEGYDLKSGPVFTVQFILFRSKAESTKDSKWSKDCDMYIVIHLENVLSFIFILSVWSVSASILAKSLNAVLMEDTVQDIWP